MEIIFVKRELVGLVPSWAEALQGQALWLSGSPGDQVKPSRSPGVGQWVRAET